MIGVICAGTFGGYSGTWRAGLAFGTVTALTVLAAWAVTVLIIRSSTENSPKIEVSHERRIEIAELYNWGIWLVILAWYMFFPLLWFHGVHESNWQADCRTNLEILATAMSNYSRESGSFGSTNITDEQGDIVYSWRVSLLGSLGEETVLDQLDMTCRWDDAANMEILDHTGVHGHFQCPSERQACTEVEMRETSYTMIVGPGMISDGPAAVRPEEITDGLENTILFVETKDSGIHWAEPRDLEFDEMSFRINDPDRPSISSHHPGGAYVVFCDGRVRFLKNDTDPKIVRALLTIAGGEDVSEFLKTLDEEALIKY